MNSDKFPIGSVVKIVQQPGEYKVMGYNKDGSYLLYGGTSGHGSYRDSHSIKLAKKPSKRLEK